MEIDWVSDVGRLCLGVTLQGHFLIGWLKPSTDQTTNPAERSSQVQVPKSYNPYLAWRSRVCFKQHQQGLRTFTRLYACQHIQCFGRGGAVSIVTVHACLQGTLKL